MSDSLLRRSLSANAIFSAICGVVLVTASTPLAGPLEIPAGVLATIGAALIPFAAYVALVARRPEATAVRVVVGADLTWVIAASALIVGLGSALATTAMVALALVSLVVADLAVLQYVGLRRATRSR